jgi:hypothetical protein
MGVGYQGLQFALLAKRRRVDFSRTITLGRQNHYLDAATLRSMFDRFGFPLSAADEGVILQDPYSENLFKKLGAVTAESVDASDYEGANLIHDFNNPIDPLLNQRYSCVVDFGSLEHIFNFPVAIKNITDLIEVGGHFLSMTTANNFMGHGFYQFSPELFFSYLSVNGFSEIEIYLVPFRIFPYFFRVKDPRELGGRVELVNSEPVLIAVMAKKKKHVSQAVVPMQSDYFQKFWRGRDVNRRVQAPPTDPKLTAALQDLKLRVASLIAWPEIVSPHLTNGFENVLQYELVDPAKDAQK